MGTRVPPPPQAPYESDEVFKARIDRWKREGEFSRLVGWLAGPPLAIWLLLFLKALGVL